MLTVACVCKSGGDYDAEYVRALSRAVERWMPEEVEWQFVCLTDLDEAEDDATDIIWLPFQCVQPGWWSKPEMFLLDGPVIYFDLDTVIVGPLDALVKAVHDLPIGHVIMLADWYCPKRMNSSMVAWNGNLQEVGRYMIEEIRNNLHTFTHHQWPVVYVQGRGQWTGDQEYIEQTLHEHGYEVVAAQDVVGEYGKSGYYSLKQAGLDAYDTLTDQYSIVFFHGTPRPRQLAARPSPPKWLTENWTDLR